MSLRGWKIGKDGSFHKGNNREYPAVETHDLLVTAQQRLRKCPGKWVGYRPFQTLTLIKLNVPALPSLIFGEQPLWIRTNIWSSEVGLFPSPGISDSIEWADLLMQSQNMDLQCHGTLKCVLSRKSLDRPTSQADSGAPGTEILLALRPHSLQWVQLSYSGTKILTLMTTSLRKYLRLRSHEMLEKLKGRMPAVLLRHSSTWEAHSHNSC
nr:calmodulin-binding protein 60 D-like [Ipomoea batatas]